MKTPLSLRAKPCACQFGNWAKQYTASGQQCGGWGRHLQQQPCFSLTGVFGTPFQQTWRQAAPNCSGWDGRLSGAGRGGAPHQTRGFGPTDPQKQGQKSVCFTCKTSQHVLQCRKTFGPTPRGVIQRQCSAGNRAHANLGIGLSSTAAANLAANMLPQASRHVQQQLCPSTGASRHTPFQQTWQQAAPNCSGWEWALVKREEGRGPAPNTGLRPSRPQHNREAWD